MLSKFYFFLRGQSEKLEAKLAQVFNQDLAEPYKTKLFSLGLMSGGLYLFALNLVSDFFKFLIILFSDSGAGFNVLFKQRELTSCPYSYHNYKLIRQKIRTFSFSTLTVIVVATVVSTLVLNLMFGGKLPGWAATFTWTQNSWTGGASSTAMAKSSTDQASWQKFSTSTNIVVGSSGISLASSTQTTTVDDVDTDFNAGTKTSNMYVSGGKLYLQKPIGATCASDSECVDGMGNIFGGWCYLNTCTSPLIYNSACPGIYVYRRDSSGDTRWSIVEHDCVAPYCTKTGYTDDLVADNSVNFSNYPARNLCKSIGGRLPTSAELVCMYNNASQYFIAIGAAAGLYRTSTEESSSYSYLLWFNGGVKYTSYNKTTGLPQVRCVKSY